MNISSIANSIGSLAKTQANPTQKNDGATFSSMLNDAMKEVNTSQVEGYKAMEGIATGNVKNLQEAVQKIEEAELSLKLALEVKNKAINAYKEISKMQV
ncbi:flagellar hook-basal body complex protein FliE [Arcobacter arenosus]|jgi:flagellar hook-basal body complex protein FliE|uniref:Flagellar hook-basal body complex protein FliE n=1 Tax=Arcobacter arenosus TaxID=2576037 RepID=A0A5R8XYN4_9BACT|nr:flagellar hook-basal body complex protein FliE [Arcobacter arenosus]TLP36994.1 flagellar hook-basal body complex protein FliE [Arcobacter arenosus]